MQLLREQIRKRTILIHLGHEFRRARSWPSTV